MKYSKTELRQIRRERRSKYKNRLKYIWEIWDYYIRIRSNIENDDQN